MTNWHNGDIAQKSFGAGRSRFTDEGRRLERQAIGGCSIRFVPPLRQGSAPLVARMLRSDGGSTDGWLINCYRIAIDLLVHCYLSARTRLSKCHASVTRNGSNSAKRTQACSSELKFGRLAVRCADRVVDRGREKKCPAASLRDYCSGAYTPSGRAGRKPANGAEMPGIGGDGGKCLGRCAQQDRIDGGLVLERDLADVDLAALLDRTDRTDSFAVTTGVATFRMAAQPMEHADAAEDGKASPKRASEAAIETTFCECRKINSGRGIPSCRAIAGAKLQGRPDIIARSALAFARLPGVTLPE